MPGIKSYLVFLPFYHSGFYNDRLVAQMELELMATVTATFETMNNTEGVLFSDMFPNTTASVSPSDQLYVMFVSIQGSVYFNVLFNIFYDVYLNQYSIAVGSETYRRLSSYSIAVGSETYWRLRSSYAETYIQSGFYKQSLANAFLQSGEYMDAVNHSDNGKQSFDEFVDAMYEGYGFEDVYFALFEYIYEDMYAMVIRHGELVLETNDLKDVATDRMR